MRSRPAASRDELFVTTKLWMEHAGQEATPAAFERSLDRLGLDYVDLYLIHQPFNDYYGAWRAMEQLHAQGRARAIGVSNFLPDRLVDLIVHNDVSPAVNQIETHVFYQRGEDHRIMNAYGVRHESWGPFAEGRNNMFTDPTLTAIAAAHGRSVGQVGRAGRSGRSVGQVVLRWLIQRDVIAIPKSVRPERMRENLAVFDFELTAGQMDEIAAMDTNTSLFFDHRDRRSVLHPSHRRLMTDRRGDRLVDTPRATAAGEVRRRPPHHHRGPRCFTWNGHAVSSSE